MAVSKMSQDNKARLEKHSQRIQAIEQEQAEHFKLLTNISSKLSPEFFEQFHELYEYIVISNGQPSLKDWRRGIDKRFAELDDAKRNQKGEANKYIFFIITFIVGALVNYFLR